METDVIFVLAMLASLVGSAIFLKRIFTASNNKARFGEFGKYALCVTAFLICAWGFTFTNNLLWFGQNPENAAIEMNINTEAVEETSFLYLLQELDATAAPEDVIALMGSGYEEFTEGNYILRYAGPGHTLNGKQPSYISFLFNRQRTEILKIVWSYEDPVPTLFADTLAYLEANALGKAAASTANTADWAGMRLEDNEEFLLLQRIY